MTKYKGPRSPTSSDVAQGKSLAAISSTNQLKFLGVKSYLLTYLNV